MKFRFPLYFNKTISTTQKVKALCQLWWVEKKLRSRKNEFRPFFFDAESDENPFFEIFKDPKTKGISFDKFDEIIGRFQFGVGIG